MINFIYLVQGRAEEIDRFNDILKGRDYLLLTWDSPCSGAIFLPNSTWSEGRRALFSAVNNKYEYYVFVDGDALFSINGLIDFERVIVEKMPCAAVPVFPKTKRYAFGKIRKWQLAYDSDEQFQAIHRSLIDNVFFGSPYSSAYDEISWWYPCVLVQNVLLKFFRRSFIQVNTFFVSNDYNGSYTNNFNSREIDGILEELGCKSALPLMSNGRSSGFLKFKKRLRLDRWLAIFLAVTSPLLFVSYINMGRSLPSQLSEHFRIQNKNN